MKSTSRTSIIRVTSGKQSFLFSIQVWPQIPDSTRSITHNTCCHCFPDVTICKACGRNQAGSERTATLSQNRVKYRHTQLHAGTCIHSWKRVQDKEGWKTSQGCCNYHTKHVIHCLDVYTGRGNQIKYIWDLRLLQQWCCRLWRWLSSGLLRGVVWYKLTDVTASIIRANRPDDGGPPWESEISLRWSWSSGLWRRVVLWVVTNVSEEHISPSAGYKHW
jgi:hypothetical protein